MKRLLLAIIAAIGVSACSSDGGDTSGTTPGDSLHTARVAVLAHINQLRATMALPALTEWTAGESCADAEAHSDFTAQTTHSAFGQCSEGAQNECPDWPNVSQVTNQCIQQMWDEGPGDFSTHGDYINLSSMTYTKAAIGFYTTPTNTVWAVMNLAP